MKRPAGFVCDGTCAGNEFGDCNHFDSNSGLRGSADVVIDAAKAFILGYEFEREPSTQARHFIDVLGRWRGTPLEIGRNGEGGYVVCKPTRT